MCGAYRRRSGDGGASRRQPGWPSVASLWPASTSRFVIRRKSKGSIVAVTVIVAGNVIVAAHV
jgi:hypothetical protein